MASVYDDWDSQDNFSAWTFTGASGLSHSRIASPAIDYRGGVGRILSTGVSTSYTWTAKHSLTSGRFARWSGAIRFGALTLVADRQGPFSILTVDENGVAATNLITQTFASDLRLGLSGDGSGTIPIGSNPNHWLLFEFVGQSEDLPGLTDTQPFNVTARINFWLERGTRLWPMGGLAWTPSAMTDVHRFSQFLLGWGSMNQTTETFDLFLDEWRQETGSTLPLSRLPRTRRHPWPTTLS